MLGQNCNILPESFEKPTNYNVESNCHSRITLEPVLIIKVAIMLLNTDVYTLSVKLSTRYSTSFCTESASALELSL